MNADDQRLYEIINKGIMAVENFRVDFCDEYKLQVFLEIIDEFFKVIDSPSTRFEDVENINIQKQNRWNQIEMSERDIAWRRKNPARLFLYNSDWKEQMELDEEIWSDMDRFLTEGTMNEFNRRIPLYYKNFMKTDAWEKYENMLELIRSELVSYNTRLIYCKKIISFLNEEFAVKGVILSHTNFLNHFLNTAISEMILVAMKLFATTNTNKNENFGFYQLKNYIANSCDENENVRRYLGDKKLKSDMKKGKEKCEEFKVIRDALIAHYDIDRIQEAKDIRVTVEDLEEWYNLSVEIFEKLSFYKFHREDCAYAMMIKFHGFAKAVCQNVYENNLQSDLDEYFDVLRMYFVDNLKYEEGEMNSM